MYVYGEGPSVPGPGVDNRAGTPYRGYTYIGEIANRPFSIMDLTKAIQSGRERLRRAIEEYRPNRIFAGFSGGTDSLVATHLLNRIRTDVGTIHINTGIGMKRTRKYVRDTADLEGWDLVEYKAKEQGYDYDEMVRGNTKGVPGGFPGPPMHTYYYRRLKERQLEQAHRDFKGERGGKIMMVTGIREDESQVRAGYKNQVKAHNGVVWVSIIYDVSATEKQRYIDLHGLETNPVADVYGMSGECLCGAFDEDGGRLTELQHCCKKFGEPETYQRIIDLQEEVRERYPWRWDERRPDWYDRAKNGQLALDVPGGEEANRVARMCHGCGKGGPEYTVQCPACGRKEYSLAKQGSRCDAPDCTAQYQRIEETNNEPNPSNE